MNNVRNFAKQITTFIRRHLLVLLVAAYFCSTFFPTPGLWLQAPFSTASRVSLIHVMLATLLFTLGLSISWNRLHEVIRECQSAGIVLVVRMAMCGLLILLTPVFPTAFTAAMVGFILIMATPTAASSSGWSMQLGCNESVTIAIILGTTIASAVTAPLILSFGAQMPPEAAGEALSLLREVFDPGLVLYWVLIPTLLGISTRSLFARRAETLRKFGHAISPVVLLLLNYANASSSLPQLREAPSISTAAATVIGCIVLFTSTTCLIRLASIMIGADRSRRLSLILGAGMCNTGLALIVATQAMPKDVEIHMAIIAYKFVQHFSVAILARMPESKQWKPVAVSAKEISGN